MYLIIAYHGNGKDEVEDDLKLLWNHIRDFAKFRSLRHIYCFQAVRDRQGADTLIVIQYDGVAAKLQYSSSDVEKDIAVSQTHHHDQVDYWFYVRNQKQKQGGPK